MSRGCRPRGFTLIELIVFIVIVSVALVGVLTVFNVTTKSSADPMIRKQMLAIAEAVLEEVMLQPFTWCDPDDSQAATATSNAVGASGCTSAATVEGIGKESTEARGTTTPLDNVSDYDGENINTNVVGTASSMPAGYLAHVVVTDTSAAAANRLGGITADTDVLLITVTVCHAAACPSVGADSIVLEGYRTRHSPNMLP